MKDFGRFAIAERLRGLLSGQDSGIVGGTANRLGVSEVALRMSLDELDPHPALEVLIAVVRDYGVDPNWLVDGEYDTLKHRQALEDDAAIARVLAHAIGPNQQQGGRRPAQALRSSQPELMTEPDVPRQQVAMKSETRTRVVDADGTRWKIREEPWPTVDRRSGTCLIFEADMVVRRVRSFPAEWYEWSDTDLYALSLAT